MFADSMLETSWAQRSRRSWTTFTSFGLQTAAIGVLLMVPLLTTVGMPSGRVLQPPMSWGAPPPPVRPATRQHRTILVQSNLADNVLIAPRSIPPTIQIINETELPPQVSYNSDPGVLGAPGSPEGILHGIGSPSERVMPKPAPPVSTKPAFRRSNMLEGSLIRRVEPKYPPLAISARIQGKVVLDAVISKAGTIDKLRLVSGHPMLVGAARDAVSQWRYRPYILNGDVIEVETQITVNFVLAGN